MGNDSELLRRYCEKDEQTAFAEIVRRHINLVYGVAVRHSRSHHRAEDVTQMVFSDLARKASALRSRPEIVGWLYTSARYAAIKVVRAEARRSVREQEAQMMLEPATSELSPSPQALDEALDRLKENDRTALLLRYCEDRSWAEVAKALLISEDSARKRVERATEQVRARLLRLGVNSTAAAVAAGIGEAAIAAPAGLAARAIGGVGAAAGAGSATGIFAFMATSKVVLGVVGLAAALAISCAVGEFWAARAAHRRLDAAARDRASAAAGLAAAHRLVDERNAALLAALRRTDVTQPGLSKAMTDRQTTAEIMRRNPAVVAKARELNRRYYASKYAALINKLGLTPAQVEQFENILTDRSDLKAANYVLRAHSPDDSALRDAELTQLLGENGFQAFQEFDQASQMGGDAFRGLLAQIAQIDPESIAAGALLQPFFLQRYDQMYQEAKRAGAESGEAQSKMYHDLSAVAEASLTPRQFEALQAAIAPYLTLTQPAP